MRSRVECVSRTLFRRRRLSSFFIKNGLRKLCGSCSIIAKMMCYDAIAKFTRALEPQIRAGNLNWFHHINKQNSGIIVNWISIVVISLRIYSMWLTWSHFFESKSNKKNMKAIEKECHAIWKHSQLGLKRFPIQNGRNCACICVFWLSGRWNRFDIVVVITVCSVSSIAYFRNDSFLLLKFPVFGTSE